MPRKLTERRPRPTKVYSVVAAVAPAETEATVGAELAGSSMVQGYSGTEELPVRTMSRPSSPCTTTFRLTPSPATRGSVGGSPESRRVGLLSSVFLIFHAV